MSKDESRRNSLPRRARRLLVYYLTAFTCGLIKIVPQRTAYCLLEFLAGFAWIVVGRQRRNALRNLRTGLPRLSDQQRRLIAKRMYRNLGRNVVEFVRFQGSGKNGQSVEIVGREYLDRAYAKEKGVLLLSAHVGNWELLASELAASGYKLTVLARRIYYGKYESFLHSHRLRKGVSSVDRNNIRGILRRLKDGHLMGILTDQDVRKLDGVYVSFLDKLCYTPTGIITLALRTGAPIIPIFIVRQSQGHHRICCEPEFELVRTGNKGWDALINTIRYTEVIEKYVRAYPEQWMWFHDRWRHRPDYGFLNDI